MAQATSDVHQLLDKYNDLFGGDLSNLDVVAESYTFSFSIDEVHGRDELEAFLREQETAFPDTTVETAELVVGEDVVMQEFVWSATHKGEFEGVPASGNEIEVRGVAVLTIENGLIRADCTYNDAESFTSQLGASE